MNVPRLPKRIQDDPGAAGLAEEIAARSEPLAASVEWGACRVEFTPGLKTALRGAFATGRIARGLEGAERRLAVEQRGLEHVDQSTGVDRGDRISRLLVLAGDGSDRFYRNVAFLLRRHAPRVLALRLDVGEDALGGLLFGADQVARLLLIQHKDAVSAVLLALAAEWRHAERGKPESVVEWSRSRG